MNFVSDGSRERKIDLQTAFKGLGEYLLSIEGIQVTVNLHIGTILNCEAVVRKCNERMSESNLI